MESTLPLPFLISVAVPPGLGGATEGLNREEVSCLGCVFFEVTPKSLEKLLRFLKQHNVEFQPFFDVTRLESRDDVLTLLDAGARKVFVKPEQLGEYTEYGSRVAPVVAGSNAKQLASASEHGLLITEFDPTRCEVPQFIDECKARKVPSFFIKPVAGSFLVFFVVFAALCSAVFVLPSAGLSTAKEVAEGKLSLPKLLASTWSSDRADKLIPTVVTDEKGIALGLVYSSEESVGGALRAQA